MYKYGKSGKMWAAQSNEILMVVDGTSCQLRKVGSVEGLVPLSRSTTWFHQGSSGIFLGESVGTCCFCGDLYYIYVYIYIYIYIHILDL